MNVLFACSLTRLGYNGSEEVKSHPFFKNEQWNFNTIRNSVPPIVHDLSGDDDTRNFDDVEENEAPTENFPTPKAFAGNHLPFVGFTYSKDYQLLTGASSSSSEDGGNRPPPLPNRQTTRTSLNLGASDSGVLAEQLLRERERAEELNNRLNKAVKDLAEAGRTEADLRSESGTKEKVISTSHERPTASTARFRNWP